MKFDDEGSNVQQGDGSIDRSQGAARAISVSAASPRTTLFSQFRIVIHRPVSELERHPVVQEHH